MSTPKPGQIRCPTCLRSTPPAAYCTQCGSPIPQSARARPRGMDREELEERVRRRPGEGGFRRGTGGEAGYVPFQPEPEDSLAVRRRQEAAARRVDHLPPEPEQEEQWPAADREEVVVAPPPPSTEAPPGTAATRVEQEPEYDYAPEAYDDTPYGRPEDAYAHPYYSDERRRGGGGGALPIIGFVVLCVLALGVGAVLAGLLGGDDDPAGQASPSASVEASAEPSTEASTEPSSEDSGSAGEETPQPSDGPVAFPDGGLLTVQPCATNAYRDEAIGRPEEAACQVDGSTVDNGDVTAVIVFNGIDGSDTLTLQLRSNGEPINEQEQVLSSVVSCGADCNGLIYGASYRALDPGDYELVLNRNGEFADAATFVVEG